MPKDQTAIPEYVHRPVAHLNNDVPSSIIRIPYLRETVSLAGQRYAARGKAGHIEFDFASCMVKPRLISEPTLLLIPGVLSFLLLRT